MNALTPSESLHSYIDGELPIDSEEILFTMLNNSSELRSEMRDLLAMRRAVRDDRVAFAPPLASSAAIMGALGMSLPVAATTAAALSGGGFAALWSKLWIPVLSAISASLLTFGIVSATYNSKSTSSPTIQTLQDNMSSSSAKNPSPQQQTNQKSFAQQQTVYQTQQPAKIVTKIVYIERPDIAQISSQKQQDQHIQTKSPKQPISTLLTQTLTPNPPNQVPFFNNDDTTDQSSRMSAWQQSPTIFNVRTQHIRQQVGQTSSNQNSTHTDITTVYPSMSPTIIIPEKYPKFWGQLRGASPATLLTMNSSTLSTDLGLSTALGAFYSFSENDAFGIEVGSEQFMLKFNGTQNGDKYNYEGTPRLFWIGASYQYRMNSIGGFQPFGQVLAGGTEYGMIGKSIVGTYYSFTPRLRMMIGVEGSALGYTYQRQTFVSPSVGITYGLSWQF